MKRIAVEEHFYTQGYIEYLRSRKKWPKLELVVKDGRQFDCVWSSPSSYRLIPRDIPHKTDDLGEGRLKDMDALGIDMQVLSLSYPGVELLEIAEGPPVARSINDELHQILKKYPDRFAGFATIAPQDPDAAAEELERTVRKLGFKGAMVTGHIHGDYLDEPKFWAIFEAAEKLDVPIYIHPGLLPEDMNKKYLKYPGLDSTLLGFAADAGLHAMCLLLSGVFEKYPRLKIILGHMGEAMPFWLWRMDSRIREQKVMDPSAASYYQKLHKNPSQYFRDNFYVTTSGMFWQPSFDFVKSVLGIDRILFATDYPYEAQSDVSEFINSLSLNNTDKAKLYHKNAEKLFRI